MTAAASRIARVLVVVPKQAVAVARRADQKHGKDEDQAADGAGLAFEEKGEQVQDHEHDVVVEQGRVDRLGDQQHRDQPLKAIH